MRSWQLQVLENAGIEIEKFLEELILGDGNQVLEARWLSKADELVGSAGSAKRMVPKKGLFPALLGKCR
jgi:hypothetical protein